MCVYVYVNASAAQHSLSARSPWGACSTHQKRCRPARVLTRVHSLDCQGDLLSFSHTQITFSPMAVESVLTCMRMIEEHGTASVAAPLCARAELGGCANHVWCMHARGAAHAGDFSFNYRLFNFANPPPVKLSTAAPADPKDKKVRGWRPCGSRQPACACLHLLQASAQALRSCTGRAQPRMRACARACPHTRTHTHIHEYVQNHALTPTPHTHAHMHAQTHTRNIYTRCMPFPAVCRDIGFHCHPVIAPALPCIPETCSPLRCKGAPRGRRPCPLPPPAARALTLLLYSPSDCVHGLRCAGKDGGAAHRPEGRQGWRRRTGREPVHDGPSRGHSAPGGQGGNHNHVQGRGRAHVLVGGRAYTRTGG